jgi:hypothetical protein
MHTKTVLNSCLQPCHPLTATDVHKATTDYLWTGLTEEHRRSPVIPKRRPRAVERYKLLAVNRNGNRNSDGPITRGRHTVYHSASTVGRAAACIEAGRDPQVTEPAAQPQRRAAGDGPRHCAASNSGEVRPNNRNRASRGHRGWGTNREYPARARRGPV